MVGVISFNIMCIKVDLFVLFGLSRVRIFFGCKEREILLSICWLLKVMDILFRVIRVDIMIMFVELIECYNIMFNLLKCWEFVLCYIKING